MAFKIKRIHKITKLLESKLEMISINLQIIDLNSAVNLGSNSVSARGLTTITLCSPATSFVSLEISLPEQYWTSFSIVGVPLPFFFLLIIFIIAGFLMIQTVQLLQQFKQHLMNQLKNSYIQSNLALTLISRQDLTNLRKIMEYIFTKQVFAKIICFVSREVISLPSETILSSIQEICMIESYFPGICGQRTTKIFWSICYLKKSIFA